MSTESSVSKSWELTLYEINRKPQEPITDGTVIAVSPRSLRSELMCPICLDILKVTMTTKECLHRFCSECIITALRSGNKECPTCRKKLVSKRSLRRDPNFDALISKIYPTRQEYEAHQDKILARLNRQHLNTTLTRSLEQQLGGNRIRNSLNGRSHVNSNGIASSNDLAEDEEFGMNNLDLDSKRRHHHHHHSEVELGLEPNSTGRNFVHNLSTSSATTNSNNHHNHPADYSDADSNSTQNHLAHTTNSSPIFPEIEVLLKPHPRFNQNLTSASSSSSPNHHQQQQQQQHHNRGNNHDQQTSGPIKYLKAPTITTVDHLCRYLNVRINLQRIHSEINDDTANFILYCLNEVTNTFTHLDSHTSIDDISRTYFHGATSLDLYYGWDDLEES